MTAQVRALADALAFEAIRLRPDRRGEPRRYRATGVLGQREVFVGAEQHPPHHLPIRIMAGHARDLDVVVFTRPPRPIFGQLRARFHDGLWFRGDGRRDRADALLASRAGAALRTLAALDVELDDRGLSARLPADAPVASHVEQVHRLVGLAVALDEAALAVPVDPAIAWAAPRFADAATELGLTFTPCALGVHGVVDGCRIKTQAVPLRSARLTFVHVELAAIMPGQWSLRARDRGWWSRLGGAVDAAIGRGPGARVFAFDRRFAVTGDRAGALRAVTGHLDALIALADVGWLSVHGDRLIAGFRLRRRTMPDLIDLVRRTVTLARRIGGGPALPVPSGPFR